MGNSKIKKIVILVIGLLVAFFVADGIVTLFMKNIYFPEPLAFSKYGSKTEQIFSVYTDEPKFTTAKEEAADADTGEAISSTEGSSAELTEEEIAKKSSLLYKLRVLLSNETIDVKLGFISNLVCGNFKNDVAQAFYNVNETTPLMSGWWVVATSEYDVEDSLKGNIGIVSVDELCKQPYAEELYKTLDSNKSAKVRMDSYAVDHAVIVPIKISVIDNSGNTIAQFEGGIAPEGYELVENSTAGLPNNYKDNEPFENASTLYEKMKGVRGGERPVDRRLNDLSKGITFGGNSSEVKNKIGICKYNVATIGVSGDNAFIRVDEYIYVMPVLVYFVIIGFIWTLICTLAIWRHID